MPQLTRHLLRPDRHLGICTLFLFLLLLTCYANTFNASWQLDDKPNIVNNRQLHIDNLRPATLWDTCFAKPGAKRRLYRPVAMLTFALNWYVGRDNPAGYHMVNLCIHWFNSILVYLLILRLLHAPSIGGRYNPENARFIALFGALLWALNPVQTQAVTYVVQRMALLATFFYLLGMYSYLAARQCQQTKQRVGYAVGTFVCYLLAVGSKENAILLPVSLLLMEWIFFSSATKTTTTRRQIRWLVIPVVLAFVLVFGLFALSGRLVPLFDGYHNRPFTMVERLMTQGRIIVWYLSLLLYPAPFRLSIEHDVNLSTSFFSPWTTLTAWLTILTLAVFALRQKNKTPLLSFGILFFLANHMVESSILPLELIFEHRNYLPSCFVFVPLAVGMKTLLDCYHDRKKGIFLWLYACVPLLVILLGIGTYHRNLAWSTEWTLWSDARQKAPLSARPLVSMALLLTKKPSASQEELDRALALYFQSLELRNTRKNTHAAIVGNMASIFHRKNDLPAAIALHRRALVKNPKYIQSRYNLSVLLNLQGQWDAAVAEIDKILGKGIVHQDYFNLKGLALLWQKRSADALRQFRKSISLEGDKTLAYMGIGAALRDLGNHRQAEWFLQRVYHDRSDSIMVLFLLIDNAMKADDGIAAQKWTERLVVVHPLETITGWLAMLPAYYASPPVCTERITPIIMERAQAITERMGHSGPVEASRLSKKMPIS